MLSEKASRILSLLLSCDQAPVTIRQIAQSLEISERSAGTYLKQVVRFCGEQHLEIVNKPGTGVLLRAGDRREELLRELSGRKNSDSAQYRMNYMISLLLNNWTTYTIALFADDLGVSKTTVEGDLREAEKWFARFKISVLKKAGQGVCLQGEEMDIRRAIVEINRSFFPVLWISISVPADCRLSEETLHRLESVYRGYSVEYYVRLVQQADKLGRRMLTDSGFETMLEYLMVAHRRILRGHVLKEGIWRENPHDRPQIEIQTEIYARELGLPAGEEEYVEMLLCCMEFQYSEKRRDELFEQARPELLEFAKKLIAYVEHAVGVELGSDLLLLKWVYYFVRSSLVRVQFGIEQRNPFLEEIKKTYPAVFYACFAAGTLYQERVGRVPSENEISTLSLLLGGAVVRSDKRIRAVVVCAAGIGTGQMVSRRIEAKHSQIEILATLSLMEQDQISRYRPQLVISTVAGLQTEFPTVIVSPVLGDADLKRLDRASASVYTKASGLRQENSMTELLHPELIFLDSQDQNKEKILQRMAQAMQSGGYVREGFYQDMLKREGLGPTALGKGVAIPHGVSGLVLRPAIGFTRLVRSVEWAGEPVDLIFALALNFEDAKSTRTFFQGFYRLIHDPESLELIRRAVDARELLKILGERGN